MMKDKTVKSVKVEGLFGLCRMCKLTKKQCEIRVFPKSYDFKCSHFKLK